jgi:hypothetical protein
MNRTQRLAGLLGALLFFAVVARAQDKPKSAEAPVSGTPIKVQLAISEFDGDNKISSTPYTITLRATSDRSVDWASLRVGIRVPITMANPKGEGNTITYQDVGTNIDCSAQEMGEKGYLLQITAERSSLYSQETGVKNYPPVAVGQRQPIANQPIMRQFRSRFVAELRDGQTAETTLATDPLNGHILKINVTLNVIK